MNLISHLNIIVLWHDRVITARFHWRPALMRADLLAAMNTMLRSRICAPNWYLWGKNDWYKTCNDGTTALFLHVENIVLKMKSLYELCPGFDIIKLNAAVWLWSWAGGPHWPLSEPAMVHKEWVWVSNL